MKIEQDWLKDARLRRLFSTVEAAGGEARVVGGAVRDALLGRPVGDIDLACNLTPEQITKACEAEGLKVVPTGIKHGTVTVVIDHTPFEVTTLRRDEKTDGRHAEVAFTDSWQEDAARRDFTMNALYCNAQGDVTDFFTGLEDLKAGRVRFVGNPLQRIREDVLRILRFFRFHAHYGQGEPDAPGYTACGMLAPTLHTLSRERVRAELLKLLKAPNPVPVVKLMIECGAVHSLKLPLRNHQALAALVDYETSLKSPDALRRLFALMDDGANLARFASELRLSNSEADRLRDMAQPLLLSTDEIALRRHAYWHGPQMVADHLVLHGKASAELLMFLRAYKRPEFPLRGEDLMALGVPAGPRLGEQLKRIESWWAEQNFTPDKAACLAQAHV